MYHFSLYICRDKILGHILCILQAFCLIQCVGQTRPESYPVQCLYPKRKAVTENTRTQSVQISPLMLLACWLSFLEKHAYLYHVIYQTKAAKGIVLLTVHYNILCLTERRVLLKGKNIFLVLCNKHIQRILNCKPNTKLVWSKCMLYLNRLEVYSVPVGTHGKCYLFSLLPCILCINKLIVCWK